MGGPPPQQRSLRNGSQLIPLPVSGVDLALGLAIVVLGCAVQGYVGLGYAIVAAPLLLILDPDFVPGPLLASGVMLTVLMVRREHRAIRWQGIGYCFAGRIFGVVPALFMLTRVSSRTYDLIFGVLVLTAVGLSLASRAFEPNAPRLWLAGTASGFMGTLSSIGGPPLALVYQHSPPRELRATLSVHFIVGASMALAGLASIGRYGFEHVLLSVVMLPSVVAGFVLARWLLRRVQVQNARAVVLVLAAVAGCAVLVRAFVATG